MNTAAPLRRQAFQAWAFERANRLFGGLQRGLAGLMPPPMRLLQISSAFWQSRALYVAARLDLATVLGDETLCPTELARRVGAQADGCERLLRFLLAMGVFRREADGRVANNPASNALRSDRPECVRHMVLMHNSPDMTRPWIEGLEAGLRHCKVPFEQVHGKTLFEHMEAHPELEALFAKAMDEVGALSGDSFATALDWGRFERLIDLGGGKGAKAAAILQRHPKLNALVMDRPGVIAQAQHWWQAELGPALAARVEFRSGDLMLDRLPVARGPADVFLLAAVLHGCDDTAALALLRHVREAVGHSGALVVLMEVVMAECGADLATAGMDMQMLMATRGRERTQQAWRTLVEAAGFVLRERVGMASLGAMLVLQGRG